MYCRSWKEKTCCRRSQLRCLSQIIQQKKLELTFLNSNTVYKAILDHPLQIKINSQLNADASTIKVDVSFLEPSKPSGDDYVNVQQNFPEWLEMRRNKVKESRLLALLGFYGKKKFEMTWNIAKSGTEEPEMKYIKRISKRHQF